jgi:hypothetical protein
LIQIRHHQGHRFTPSQRIAQLSRCGRSCWEGAQDVAIFAAYPRTTQVAPNVPAFVRYLAVVYDAAPP